MTDIEEVPTGAQAYAPPLRDPVAVPTAHVTVPVSVPDPSDAAADGTFGGVKPKAQKDHRAGYGRPFEELLDWARKPADLRSSDVARLVAEIDQLRDVLALLKRPSDLTWNAFWVTQADVGTMEAFAAAVAAAEREAGR